MPRYTFKQAYANDRFFGSEGDVVELTDAEYERLERDSPGTFELVKEKATEPVAGADAFTAEDVLDEQGAAVLTELRDQIPTIDIDPEDKAQEIPGEGNKFTPASGYNPAPQGARVVERAPKDRMKRSAAKRKKTEDEADEADEGATSADTSANARVTTQTPASRAADEKQLAGGTTGKSEKKG